MDSVYSGIPDFNDAATKIQAGYRGYRVRKQYHLAHRRAPEAIPYGQQVSQLSPAMAATRIQAGYRGYRTRHALHHKPETHGNQPVLTARERTEADKAAAKIQASFRGYMTRRALAGENTQGGTGHDRLSTTPLRTRDQNQYTTGQKSISTREDESIDPTKLNAAATKIQAGYRGYHTRKFLHKEQHELGENRGKENADQAATRIQATYRGFMTRKKLKHDQISDANVPYRTSVDENQAATKIQAAFRGFSTRQRYHIPHHKHRDA